ncbi:imidazole glycerol phosphate synthase subunit HisH [Virgibacillus byunsanensis]|uniref:Imidazole glycerol phosphate synthase subunit HisH n=1 Tax=Virgibacillus byunsanensis TaxID=570945 RepID=A0ABW3LIR9_9BACI
MITIIDYGAGNIKSLQFALTKLNLESCVTTDKATIKSSNAIILPGVGAFKDAMDALEQLELTETLKNQANSGKPILGICLGMQLFYETSFEDGEWNGLGLLKGNVKRISSKVKVPHIGWNTVKLHKVNPITDHVNNHSYVYFVHSYAIDTYQDDTLIGSTEYGGKVPAIVQKDNVIGMQFHPEKSGETGLQLLRNFGEMIS